MRTRSEQKRREIVAAAASLFVEQGYERTSMSAISERVGGSKATLYGYFESKEELLRAVLADSVAEETERLMHEFPANEAIRTGLIRLGERYLMDRLGPLPITSIRIVATQPESTGLGADFYANALRPAWQWFADRIGALMEEGRLRRADPWVAAMHWKGLHEGELFEKRLLGASTSPDPSEIRRVVADAADAFLRIYEPAPAAG
ncbi:TetR/AcrR family transcriptional regulator [Sphingobium sp. Sx8-8]|uniref:TetR/AcrR family transcriptional regulator C-terminal domain-containing protein n=1 Tax=Sphingobium sp. Sx8-8 TaxID=2933617 RepID=UPI001F55B9BE